MTVATRTVTRTHTATFLANAILGAFSDILAHLGLSRSDLAGYWRSTEAALVTWIEEGSLEKVRLECVSPSGRKAFFDVPIKYDLTGTGNTDFISQQLALARYRAKIESMPRDTTYRLLLWVADWGKAIPGWSTTTAASTDGMTSRTFGTLASGPHAAASLRYYRT